MLQPSFRRLGARGLDARDRYIMLLPLDVVLRRMQSSSLSNRARGLEAHFQVEEDGAATGHSQRQLALSPPQASTAYPSTPLRASLSRRLLKSLGAAEDGACGSAQRPIERASASHLATTLGLKSAAPQASSRDGAITMDEISLILANAIRHCLSERVVRASFAAFAKVMDDTHRIGLGGGGGSLFDSAGGVEQLAFRRAEVLTRVLESCVAASESEESASFTRCGQDGRDPGALAGLTIDMWASLVGWTAELWDALASSLSGASLLLEFYSVALVKTSPGLRSSVAATSSGGKADNAATPAGPTAATGSVLRRLSLLSLQTDPALLAEHCYKQCGRSLQRILEDLGPAPEPQTGPLLGGPVAAADRTNHRTTTAPDRRSGRAHFHLRAAPSSPPPSPQPPSSVPSRSIMSPRRRLLSRPSELVRLSHAMRHLLAYETTLHAVSMAVKPATCTGTATSVSAFAGMCSPLGAVSFTGSSSLRPFAPGSSPPSHESHPPQQQSSAVSAATAWRWWPGGRRRREYRAAVLQSQQPPPLSFQVGSMVAKHALPTRDQRASADGYGASALPQLAAVFSAIADVAPAASTTGFALHLCDLLRRERERGGGAAAVAVSAETLAGVVELGEACLRRAGDTQEVLAEVLKTLRSSAPVLAQLGFDERYASPRSRLQRGPWPLIAAGRAVVMASSAAATVHALSAVPYALWPRACQLIEDVPLTLRGAAEQTLVALTQAFLTLPTGTLVGPSQRADSCAPSSSPATLDLQRSLRDVTCQYRHGRYGALLLACQLIQRDKGNLDMELARRVRTLVDSHPFTGGDTLEEARLEVRSVVRALRVLTARVPTPSLLQEQSTTTRKNEPLYGQPELISGLLQQLSCLISEPLAESTGTVLSAPLGLGALTASERALLRESVRALRSPASWLRLGEKMHSVRRSPNVATVKDKETFSYVEVSAASEGVRTKPVAVGEARRRPSLSEPVLHADARLTLSPRSGMETFGRHPPIMRERDAVDEGSRLQKELTQLSQELDRQYAAFQ